jgi:hypothetical protein
MRLSRQDQRNYGILAAFLLVAGYVMYSELSTPAVSTPAAPVIVATPAPAAIAVKRSSLGNTAGISSKRTVLTGEAQLDPTLHMEGMLVTEALVYSGNGRNIFSANSSPSIDIPKLAAKVRTPALIAPVRLGPTGPPPPPPIDLKFFGIETNSAGDRRALLLHGDDVFFVASGEIVQRRYKVISIDPHSIVIEDMANSNRQTLPLLVH